MWARGTLIAGIALAVVLGSQTAVAATLDYDAYRTRIEPIFLKKRDGHTRCYVCHAESNNNFRLQKLASGNTSWTEDQSRKNFEMVLKLVNPGRADTSRLLLHPLAPEGGGGVFHSGGRQFASPDDPDWKILADWINGKN